MRHLATILALILTACGPVDRDNAARHAQSSLIGESRESILRCLGAPIAQAQIGKTEVWEYQAYRELRSCNASITFTDGAVSDVSYRGHSGGPLAPLQVCGDIVADCV